MTRKRALIVLFFLGCIAVSAAAGLFARHWLPAALNDRLSGMAPPSAPTVLPPASGTVAALGRLEPESEIIGVGGPPGSRIDRLDVQVGSVVEKGASLAYLDSHAEMLAACDHARKQLQEAVEQYETETTYGNALIEEARQRLEHVQKVTPLAIRAQDAEIRRSNAELDKARLDQQRAQSMLGDQAISQSQYDAARLVVRQAEEQLAHNQAVLDQQKKDQDVRLAQARAALAAAEAGLKRAQRAVQIDSLTQAVKLAETRLERTVIRAPIAGEVLRVLTRPGETIGQQAIMQMGNIGSMVAVAEVYETDVHRVQVGQKATVQSKAFPGVRLTGTVVRVSRLVHKNDVLGIDPTADADARVVEVRIRLDASDLAARFNNLQVDVTIDAW